MPELPEVETIRRGLEKAIVGQRITDVQVSVPKLFIGNPKELIGQKVIATKRRAKVFVIQLQTCYLLVHLKMTGQLIYIPTKGETVIGGHPDKLYPLQLPHKFTHIILTLEHGVLYFNDLRKFGWMKIIHSQSELKQHFADLGPEYTSPQFTLDYLVTKLARKNITIKQALLDQALVAGVGNIYADETLFASKINPKRTASSLTKAEISRIFTNIPKVFNLSLQHGGTSSQHYRQLDGRMGTFLDIANVYKREGLPCRVCGTPIKRIKISGRSSHFCPNCQK